MVLLFGFHPIPIVQWQSQKIKLYVSQKVYAYVDLIVCLGYLLISISNKQRRSKNRKNWQNYIFKKFWKTAGSRCQGAGGREHVIRKVLLDSMPLSKSQGLDSEPNQYRIPWRPLFGRCRSIFILVEILYESRLAD